MGSKIERASGSSPSRFYRPDFWSRHPDLEPQCLPKEPAARQHARPTSRYIPSARPSLYRASGPCLGAGASPPAGFPGSSCSSSSNTAPDSSVADWAVEKARGRRAGSSHALRAGSPGSAAVAAPVAAAGQTTPHVVSWRRVRGRKTRCMCVTGLRHGATTQPGGSAEWAQAACLSGPEEARCGAHPGTSKPKPAAPAGFAQQAPEQQQSSKIQSTGKTGLGVTGMELGSIAKLPGTGVVRGMGIFDCRARSGSPAPALLLWSDGKRAPLASRTPNFPCLGHNFIFAF